MKAQKKEPKPKLKVVVRHLPPQLTEDAFLSEITPFRDIFDFFYYVQGAISEKLVVDSRAYLSFPKEDALMAFTQFFDGHLFVTSKGREMKAMVEYAPFQRVVSRTKKPRQDRLLNTIESDADFLKFCEELKNPVQVLPSAEEQLDRRLAEGKENDQPVTTPLLEYLKQKKAHKRGDRKKGAKGRKEPKGGKEKKIDEKKKRERAIKKKDKEERRRKKTNTPEGVVETLDESKEKKKTDTQDEGTAKRGKNGQWVIRQLEPGAISIQTRDASTSEQLPPPKVEKVAVPQSRGNFHGRGHYGGGRGGRQKDSGERSNPLPNNRGNKPGINSRRGAHVDQQQGRMKIYAPKQAQVPSVAVNNGP